MDEAQCASRSDGFLKQVRIDSGQQGQRSEQARIAVEYVTPGGRLGAASGPEAGLLYSTFLFHLRSI